MKNTRGNSFFALYIGFSLFLFSTHTFATGSLLHQILSPAHNSRPPISTLINSMLGNTPNRDSFTSLSTTYNATRGAIAYKTHSHFDPSSYPLTLDLSTNILKSRNSQNTDASRLLTKSLSNITNPESFLIHGVPVGKILLNPDSPAYRSIEAYALLNVKNTNIFLSFFSVTEPFLTNDSLTVDASSLFDNLHRRAYDLIYEALDVLSFHTDYNLQRVLGTDSINPDLIFNQHANLITIELSGISDTRDLKSAIAKIMHDMWTLYNK